MYCDYGHGKKTSTKKAIHMNVYTADLKIELYSMPV